MEKQRHVFVKKDSGEIIEGFEDEISKIMKQRGFEIKSVGGNCTAYVNSKNTIKISKMGKPYAPENINEPVLVAFYENEQFFADAVFVNVLEFFRTGKLINDYFEGEL